MGPSRIMTWIGITFDSEKFIMYIEKSATDDITGTWTAVATHTFVAAFNTFYEAHATATMADIVISGSHGILRSEDSGATWIEITSFGEMQAVVPSVVRLSPDGNTIYVMHANGNVVSKTTDNGANWTVIWREEKETQLIPWGDMNSTGILNTNVLHVDTSGAIYVMSYCNMTDGTAPGTAEPSPAIFCWYSEDDGVTWALTGFPSGQNANPSNVSSSLFLIQIQSGATSSGAWSPDGSRYVQHISTSKMNFTYGFTKGKVTPFRPGWKIVAD